MTDSEFRFTDLRRHWQYCAKKEKPQREAWAHPAMRAAFDATQELLNNGWRGASYCPKDGTRFLAWTPTMPTPFVCYYQGEWPNGKWWAEMDGDVWPQNPGPVFWKPIP